VTIPQLQNLPVQAFLLPRCSAAWAMSDLSECHKRRLLATVFLDGQNRLAFEHEAVLSRAIMLLLLLHSPAARIILLTSLLGLAFACWVLTPRRHICVRGTNRSGTNAWLLHIGTTVLDLRIAFARLTSWLRYRK
jgi:hypothetical protein